MKKTITQFLEDKDINRRVLQRNIAAALTGDIKAANRLKEKYNITKVEQVGRTHLLTIKE